MKLLETTLFSPDPSRLLEFYRDVLDLPVSLDERGYLQIEAGSSRLTFQPAGSKTPPNYHFAFNIPENQIEAAFDWIKDRCELLPWKGETIVYFGHWDAHALYFHDPDGNILELIARHSMDNASDEAFSGKNILNLSELGMVVASVSDFCRYAQRAARLPLYSGDIDEFAALGDEEGLFIVVPEGRGWLPTGRPAEAAPSQSLLEQDGKRKDLRYNGRQYLFT